MSGIEGGIGFQRPDTDNPSLGRVPNASNLSKFGFGDGFTSAGGDQVVWPTPTTAFNPMLVADTFTLTYTGGGGSNDGIGSTGAIAVLISYLDEDFALQEASVVLEADGSTETSFRGYGITRAVVVSSGSANTNNGAIIIRDTANTYGQQAYIAAGIGVTQQLIIHVPIGATYLMKDVQLNINKVGGSSPVGIFKLKTYNRFIDCQFEILRLTIDASVENTVSRQFTTGFPFGGRDVLWWTLDTTVNSTVASMVQDGTFYNLPQAIT